MIKWISLNKRKNMNLQCRYLLFQFENFQGVILTQPLQVGMRQWLVLLIKLKYLKENVQVNLSLANMRCFKWQHDDETQKHYHKQKCDTYLLCTLVGTYSKKKKQ